MRALFVLLAITTAAMAQITMSDVQMKKLGISVASVSMVQNSTIGPIIGALDFDEAKSKSYFLDHEAGIVALSVREGDKVKKGQLLCRISSPKLLADSFELREMKNRLNALSNNAKKDETLYKEGIISYREYQTSALEAQSVRSRIGVIEAQFALAGIQSGSSMAVIAQKDGIVSISPKNVGEKITPYIPYFRISDPSAMLVQLKISPKMIAYISKGSQVLDKSRKPIGSILSISPGVDVMSNSSMALARIASGDNLRAGMTSEFFVVASKPTTRTLIPSQAVVKYQGKYICFIYTVSGFKAQALNVQDIESEGYFVNQKGIDASTKVATSGLIILKGALSGLGFE